MKKQILLFNLLIFLSQSVLAGIELTQLIPQTDKELLNACKEASPTLKKLEHVSVTQTPEVFPTNSNFYNHELYCYYTDIEGETQRTQITYLTNINSLEFIDMGIYPGGTSYYYNDISLNEKHAVILENTKHLNYFLKNLQSNEIVNIPKWHNEKSLRMKYLTKKQREEVESSKWSTQVSVEKFIDNSTLLLQTSYYLENETIHIDHTLPFNSEGFQLEKSKVITAPHH